MSYNNDIDGNPSSKRRWAARFLWIGLLMAILLFIMGAWKAWNAEEFSADVAQEIMWSLIGTGTFALGITLVERFGKTKGTK